LGLKRKVRQRNPYREGEKEFGMHKPCRMKINTPFWDIRWREFVNPKTGSDADENLVKREADHVLDVD